MLHAARCLAVSWAGTLYISLHFGAVAPNRILPVAKSLCVRLVFSYFGSVTVRHSSSGRQQNFASYTRQRPSRSTMGGRTV